MGWLALLVSIVWEPSLVAGRATGRDRVFEWADSIQIERFECRFSATLGSNDGAVETLEGHWYARVLPLFAERLEYTRSVDGRFEKEERLSWDVEEGEGRVYQRLGNSVQGNGTRTISRPKGLSRAELPSDMFFFFRHDRPLGRWLRTMEVDVSALDESGERWVAFIRQDDESVVSAYVLDFSREQPVVELRAYIPPPASPIESQRSLDDGAVELPQPVADHLLFARKIVTESQEVDGVWMPLRWEVRHCLREADESITVSLEAGSIRIDGPEPEGGYQVTWPPGTRVYDYGSGASYWVAESSQKVKTEVIGEAELDAILSRAGHPDAGAGSKSRKQSIPTSCAANAAYLALALRGRAEPLEEITEALGVTPMNAVSSVADILEVLEEAGVEALAVEGGSDLLTEAEHGPLILHAVRTRDVPGQGVEEHGHFIVVDDFEKEPGTLRVFDPPSLSFRATLGQVEEAWTGRAILLNPRTIQAVTGEIKIRRVLQFSAMALGVGAVLGALFWRYRRSWGRA